MSVIEKKKHLRRAMIEKRNTIPLSIKKQYDEWVCDELKKLIIDSKFKVVHTYLPMSSEIDLIPLIEFMLENSITVISPKTLPNRKLENRFLTSLQDLEKGVAGTSHPANPSIYMGPIDMIIVPGLAFDEFNYRLGYGGGYYDNFLCTQPNALKVGAYYPTQKTETLPREDHDFRLDKIVYKDFDQTTA